VLRVAIYFFVILLLPDLAFAAAPGDRCGKLSAQQDMNACVVDEVIKADSELNSVYKQLLDKSDEAGKRNLVDAERAWIVFRDKECMLEAGYDTVHLQNNGTIAPFNVGECKLRMTGERIKTLRQLIKCPGGDMAC
jgi:uncharacterized protein YecT (DUF1311 family)